MLRNQEKEDPNSCLNKAAPDEPVFVLRAQDVTAPAVIREWLARNPQLPQAKRDEALECINQMRRWPTQKRAD